MKRTRKQWVFEGDKPAIVDFYADWCSPCRMIAPILEELAVEYEGKIDIYKVDTEAQRELAAVFGITEPSHRIVHPHARQPFMHRKAHYRRKLTSRSSMISC